MRRVFAVSAIALVAALAASTAGAKEGVEAMLLSAIPKDAAPGSAFRIEWRLAQLQDGRPFGAGGVFVRLLGPGGAATTAVAAEGQTGHFTATATVPDGGLRGIRIGLRSISCADTCTEGALFFRVVNDPFTDGFTPLRRPFHTPFIAYGAKCPASAANRRVDFARYGLGRGYGPGPAYPIGLDRGTIHLVWRHTEVDARRWGVQKVLWFVHPSYHGPVLIRGEQIDGPYRVRFDRGRIPPAELRLPDGTREHASYVRIRKPGCYAFQIDGLTFSRTIVFRAAGA
jgi:hypothetical protein